MITVTPSEAFEQGLSRSTDAVVLRGKLLLEQSTGVTPIGFLGLGPGSMGARAVALGTVFARYRFKYIRFKWLAFNTTALTTGTASLGVYDDATNAEGQIPISPSGVVELRCSSTTFLSQTIPAEFEWTPADKTLWYYTQSGATGSDPRLVASGVLVSSATNATTTMSIQVDFCMVFKGAVDIAMV
jgi:hypothetical protein